MANYGLVNGQNFLQAVYSEEDHIVEKLKDLLYPINETDNGLVINRVAERRPDGDITINISFSHKTPDENFSNRILNFNKNYTLGKKCFFVKLSTYEFIVLDKRMFEKLFKEAVNITNNDYQLKESTCRAIKVTDENVPSIKNLLGTRFVSHTPGSGIIVLTNMGSELVNINSYVAVDENQKIHLWDEKVFEDMFEKIIK